MSKIVEHRTTPLVRVAEQTYPVIPMPPHHPAAPFAHAGGPVIERYYYIQAPAPYPPALAAPSLDQRVSTPPPKASTDMSFVIALALALIAFALCVAVFKEPFVAPSVALGVVLVWLLNSLVKLLRGEG